jgi:nucleoside-diphosphate-sugar epimerase
MGDGAGLQKPYNAFTEGGLMETVLITGVAGRVGTNLALTLLNQGYAVRGLVMPDDPKATKLKGLDIESFTADLRALDGVRKAVDGVDAVVHLAAAMGKYPGMTDRDYFDGNVVGTWDVVYAAAQKAPNLQRFIFASTDATYSAYQAKYLPMDEEHPQRPFSPYGMIKILGEQIVNHYHRQTGMPTVILRFGTVMAGDQILNVFTAGHAIGNLKGAQHPLSNLYIRGIEEPWKPIEEAAGNDSQMLFIPRNLEGKPWIHNPTDVRDTVQGIILALQRKEAVGETFNILAAEGTSWEDAVLYIHEKTGRPYAQATLPNYWAFCSDITKARLALGYSPEYDYRRMVDDALAFAEGQDTGVIPA